MGKVGLHPHVFLPEQKIKCTPLVRSPGSRVSPLWSARVTKAEIN